MDRRNCQPDQDDEPFAGPWFHGSPLALSELRPGSTITRDRALAEVFSHKPTLVSVEDDATIRHDGNAPGFVYQVAAPLAAGGLVPVPGSTLGSGQEWHTTRALRLTLIERTTPRPAQRLTQAEASALRGDATT